MLEFYLAHTLTSLYFVDNYKKWLALVMKSQLTFVMCIGVAWIKHLGLNFRILTLNVNQLSTIADFGSSKIENILKF